MATNWTLTNPINKTLNSQWPQEIRELKQLLLSRLYYTATEPTARPDATAFEANDNGSIWIDSDDNKIYILTDYSGPTWTDFETVIEAMTLGLSATLTLAVAPVFTKGIVANDSYLVGRNNADDGNINIVKVNTSDGITFGVVATLPDTSALATSAAPTADAQLANKKYVDDLIASEVTMSAYTSEDSEGNSMLKSHAYLAATDGFVVASVDSNGSGTNLKGYVGTTNDPAGAGDLVGYNSYAGSAHGESICFPVAEGEYFEITTTATGTPSILWKSMGTLSKPVDQD